MQPQPATLIKYTSQASVSVETETRLSLTDVGHVQAVLLGGVVPGGGGGRHVHAVDAPHGGVAAVEVAAVGPGRSVIRTFPFGPLAVNTRGDGGHVTTRVCTTS